jgi:hypothetical protein
VTELVTCRDCVAPTGASGDEPYAGSALDQLGGVGVLVLHARNAPNTRGTIGHVVVATSGVWVVNSRYHAGRVVKRLGADASDAAQLLVGKHNVTQLVEDLRWQTEAVRAALTPIGFDDVPVTGALCFTGAQWGWFAKPIEMGSTLVTWPEDLLSKMESTALIGPAEIDFVGEHLDSWLLAAQ